MKIFSSMYILFEKSEINNPKIRDPSHLKQRRNWKEMYLSYIFLFSLSCSF